MKIFSTQAEAEAYRKTLVADEEAVAKHRRASGEAYTEKEDSFQRCDTDGFLSQWASGLTGQLEGQKAQLAKHDNQHVFRVLVDAETGELVSTKLIELFNQFAGYGTVWKWKVEGKKGVRHPMWLTDYKRPANFEKKGVRVAYACAKAYARLDGKGTGLSGTAWVATHMDRKAEGIEI